MTYIHHPDLPLAEAFALPNHSYIYLIGGGGKTTLMFTLAHLLSSAGRTVVSTTSTKILHPSATEAAAVLVNEDVAGVISRLRSELPHLRHITIARTLAGSERKLHGYSTDELDHLWQARVADYMIIEADGAAGKSLKAHADYEPVISPQADLVIAVIGCDSIGGPLTDAHVHRAARFGELLNRPLGTPVTTEDIVAIFIHPLGYLKAVPPRADVIVFITKVRDDSQWTGAEQLAAALLASDRAGRVSHVVMGDLPPPDSRNVGRPQNVFVRLSPMALS